MSGQYLTVLDHRGELIPAAALSAEYEAATTGRRLGDWGLSTTGPNDSLFSSLSTLRSRTRQAVRNNPQAQGAVDSFVSNMVGSGIVPRWKIKDNDALKDRIQELWSDSVPEMDADGLFDFYGLQALAARSIMESGEVLCRFRPMRSSDGLAVPLQLQLFEADHLDESYNDELADGRTVRMGIEFDRRGRRVAYHLFKDHPGESFSSYRYGLDRVRIPAGQILHLGQPLRPGQIRYRPWLTSVLLTLHEIDQCDDAELVRRKTTAMFGGFFVQPTDGAGAPNMGPVGGTRTTNANNIGVVTYEPGTFVGLPPGLEPKFAMPSDVSGNYMEWMKHNLRKVARGVGITYEQLTGDLEDVNYSSIRAGLLEFRRLCAMVQKQLIVFQFCRPVAQRWLAAAIVSSALEINDYDTRRRRYNRIDWRPEAWQWVDPEKEVKSEIMAVRAGFKSRSQVVAEGGRDVETVDLETAEDNRRADQNEFVNELAEMIYAGRKKKTIVAYAGGTCASAAYWLAAAAGRIVVDAASQLGSIGIMLSGYRSKSSERFEIISSQSPMKNPDPHSKDGRRALQKRVDALADVFISSVARYRSVSAQTVTDDYGRGDVLVGQAAVDAGMADALGSLES